MRYSDAHYAWCAGLFDGEGYVCIVADKRCNGVNPRLGLGMTCEVTVKHFREILGNGKINLQTWKEKENHRPKYVWSLYGSLCVKIAERLLPFSITKRKQLELIIEYYASQTRSFKNRYQLMTEEEKKTRNEFVEKMKELNKRGM